ncbi:hypothetical protein CDL12_29062 [Handroanthus impetiginosus]|uniref:Transcription repressor n=1 Tax=Handroanthus impetiginosus TaxID=429701 RepID=A0A2G9G0M5_9LAMI|nr:hypothetical protein CDL12_29062 [Handroanthus impetiginosus]
MVRRFKLRICRAIATTLQSCRSKDPSTLPQDPVPSLFSSVHAPSAFISHSCPPPSHDGATGLPPPPNFKWQKEDEWHVIAQIHQQSPPRLKINNSSDEDLTFPTPPLPPSSAEKNRRRRNKKKKNIPSKLRLSTSSADSGWFSSDCGAGDEEETETLVSSSISDSSSNLPHRRTKRRVIPNYKRTKRAVVRSPPSTAVETEIPARLSTFKKLIPCTVDGKVKESFAIVKRSEDPYEDFKNSMMDMIVEKQIFEQKDLEQLLQCFLSLNSRDYHGIIVRAFYEIWEAIFSAEASALSDHHR